MLKSFEKWTILPYSQEESLGASAFFFFCIKKCNVSQLFQHNTDSIKQYEEVELLVYPTNGKCVLETCLKTLVQIHLLMLVVQKLKWHIAKLNQVQFSFKLNYIEMVDVVCFQGNCTFSLLHTFPNSHQSSSISLSNQLQLKVVQ